MTGPLAAPFFIGVGVFLELKMTHARLAQGLLAAVRAQDFGSTADAKLNGAPVKHFPSIDLAVVAFEIGRAHV